MARIQPRFPPVSRAEDDPGGMLAGVGYWNPTDLDGDVVLGVGATARRGPLLVAGLTSFMVICATITGANVQLQFDHLDPENSATILATRTIATMVVAATPTLNVFGAFATIGPADSFILINLVFINTSGAVGASATSPRLFGTAR